MSHTLLIFIGAGLGGVCRYWLSQCIYLMLGRQFPYGTFVANISGCFLMGLLFILLLERSDGIAPLMRSFLLIGLLGGYTTFSSFSIETLQLFENGAWLQGFLNIFLSVLLCLGASWVGVMAGRQI